MQLYLEDLERVDELLRAFGALAAGDKDDGRPFAGDSRVAYEWGEREVSTLDDLLKLVRAPRIRQLSAQSAWRLIGLRVSIDDRRVTLFLTECPPHLRGVFDELADVFSSRERPVVKRIWAWSWATGAFVAGALSTLAVHLLWWEDWLLFALLAGVPGALVAGALVDWLIERRGGLSAVHLVPRANVDTFWSRQGENVLVEVAKYGVGALIGWALATFT